MASKCVSLVFCFSILAWCCQAKAQTTNAGKPESDPPGTIELRADAKEGVKLSGKAKLDKLGGKADYLASVGMTGQTVAALGLWNKVTTEESRVEFSPTLPKDGYYDVYVRWFSGSIAGNAVIDDLPITVVSAQGERTFAFGQQMGNVWVFLGTHAFKAGNAGKVIADAKGKHGAANLNAVKFVPSVQPPASMPLVLPEPKGVADDFDKMRMQLAKRLTAAAQADLSDPVQAQKIAEQEASAYFYWKTMKFDAERRQLWNSPSVPFREGNNDGGGWPLTKQYGYLLAMTRSYVGSNAPLGFASKMQGNPQLRQDILEGLKFYYEHRFNEKTVNKMGADWIGNEISNPQMISTMICLLYPHVSKEFIAQQTATFEKMAPTPLKMYGGAGTTTGFNRLYACYAYALRGLMENNAKKIELARQSISPEFEVLIRAKPMVRPNGKTSYDGFYADGSFIQHGELPYIGIYGGGVLTNYASIKELLNGSPWEINDPKAQIFNQWVTKGYAPLFYGGDIMYGSLGRSAGQSWHQDGAVSSRVIDAVAQMVPLAKSPAERQELSAILKAWIIDKEQSAFPQYNKLVASRISLPAYVVLTDIKKDASIKPQRPVPGSYMFHNTDMLVHQQADFAAQLRMFSTRIRTHEDINEGTNRLGWYQGSGSLFVYTRDNSRYNDNFWATVNPYRLPGTTVDTRDREVEGSKNGELSQSPWAGGAELDGLGVASMGLMEPKTTLAAQKSWFFLDGQIVCLGSQIKSTDNRMIETIVENVKLNGAGGNAFVVNGQQQPTDLVWKADLKDVRWAHLAGPVANSDMGWVFPQAATLQAVREARTGAWVRWFKKDETVPHTRNYLTMWYDHGANPTGASYAYIILPGRNSAQTQEYAQKPEAEILANTAELQAVRYAKRSAVAASVWTDAPTAVGEATVTGKCNIIISDDGKQLRLAVSDPTQLNVSSIRVAFKHGVSETVKADEGVKIESSNPLVLTIQMKESDGKTFRARFAR